MKVHIVCSILVILSMYSSSSYSSNEITKCDEFAAHPDDPGKWAAGVEDSDLVPAPVITYCQQAINEFPDTPRFLFQLGRVYFLQGDISRAVDSLVLAVEKGYAPANYYLAQIFEAGALGDVDLESAEIYYNDAIEGGFEIARQAKEDMLNGGTVVGDVESLGGIDQQDVSPQEDFSYSSKKSEKVFTSSDFEYSKLLLPLYEGDFKEIDALAKKHSIFIYLEKMVDIISGDFVKHDLDGECENTVPLELIARVGYMAQGLDSSGRLKSDHLSQAGNLVAARIMTMLNGGMMDVFSDIKQSEDRRKRYVDYAKRDTSALVRYYGCKSSVVTNLIGNLGAYVYGRSPYHVVGLTAIRHHCKAGAMSKGGGEKEAISVCDCFAAEFDKIGVARDEINWLGENYDQGKNFMQLTQKYDGLHEKISNCLF